MAPSLMSAESRVHAFAIEDNGKMYIACRGRCSKLIESYSSAESRYCT